MWLAGRRLAAVLALAAVLLMLPALTAGLGMDDLVQRSIQLQADQLPPRLLDTGFASRSGSLPAVLSDLFGFRGEKEAIRRARSYGLLPWWMRDDISAALWRPVTAFTHWLDYRLFPNSPMLMHAENIAWFAGTVFLAALLYRRLIRPGWVAGLAGVLFLIDKNTYFPVMFVANRGFVASLFFGLLCLLAHDRWRTTGARAAAVASGAALAFSVFCNEAGVSTLAFLISYAMFLEPVRDSSPPPQTSGTVRAMGEVSRRGRTVLPALVLLVLWRAVYQGLGFGVANVQAYIDPSREPLEFLRQLGGRSIALLAGQLTGAVPEAGMAFHPFIRSLLLPLATLVSLLIVAAAWPLLKKDRAARFWFVAMLMALVPAATVVPLSKNLGFVAVAAFGWIALWVGFVVKQLKEVPGGAAYRLLARGLCLALLLAHIPGALAFRAMMAGVTPYIFTMMQRPAAIGDWPGIDQSDVVLINAPCQLSLMAAPFVKAYEGKPLPKTLRSLLPACTGFEVERTDDQTLVVRPAGSDIFSADSKKPLHISHVFATIDEYFRPPSFTPGARTLLPGLEIEVCELSGRNMPARVSFRFARSLEASSFHWLYFDWKQMGYRQFRIPEIGQTAMIIGPP